MASPMSWIRKYQKGLMAFFGIILIGIFTITLVLPNGGNVGPTRPRTEDPVVMRWKGGQLKASEISELRFRHYQSMRFQSSLLDYAMEKKQGNVIRRVELIQSIESGNPGDVQSAEAEIVQRYILSKEAQSQGIVVSDEAVDEYLALLIDNVPMTPAEMSAVNRRANPQTEYLQVREAIRMELAARQMRLFVLPGLNFPMNPTQAAQYYTRTARLIDCEVLPYKVEDYLDKVTSSPRADELQKLYAEGRGHYPDPFDTRPGFKGERKIKLQYFVADYETFLVNEMNKLTDQEVQAEYDRRVQANDISIMEEVKPEEKKEEAPLPGDNAPQTPAEGEKKDGEQAPATPPADSGTPAPAVTPATETPATETPANPPADAPKDGDGEKKDGQAATGQTNSLTFVSFQPNSQEPEKQEPAKETPPAETPPAEPAQEPAAPATEPTAPAAQPEATQQPAAEQPAAQQPAEPAPATAENPAAAPQVPAPPVMRPKALKDVADQLKRSLKSAAALEALNLAVEEAQGAVNEFQSELQDWRGTPEKERGPEPTFDPAAIAKRLNLKFEESELLSMRKLFDSPVGKITHYIRMQTLVPETVAQYVVPRFAEMQPYRDFVFRDVFSANAGTLQRLTYVFWPTEKVEASIPTFEEARADIEKAWKLQQALALAKADADKAAAESNSSGKKLAEIFGDKAVPTGQFPWFSAGMGSFGYFTIPGVTNPGEEFMNAAFNLKPGKAAVAANDDRSQVYVIRMLSDDTRSTADMMKQLAENVTPQKPYPESLNAVATTYLNRNFSDWQNQYLDSQKIEWLNR
ncbi:MAG: hypothetical protein ACKO0N_16505 [Planctomycetota bacterium]